MTARVRGSLAAVTAALLADLRAALAADPWAAPRLVVGSVRAAQVLEVRLAQAGGAFGATVVTLRELAGELAGPVAPALAAGLRQALMREEAERVLGAAAVGPGLAASLLATYDALRAAAVPVAAWASALEAPAGAILTAFAARARPYPDGPAVLAAAARAAASGAATLPPDLWLWGIAGLSAAEARLAAALAPRCRLRLYLPDPVGLSLPDPARQRLLDAAGLSAEDGPAAPAGPICRLPAPSAAWEADLAARRILAWVEDGTPPGRLAAVGPAALLRRLSDRLEAVGVVARQAPPPLADSPFGAAALRLAAVMAEDAADDLIALLGGVTSDLLPARRLAAALASLPGPSAARRLAAARQGEGDVADMAALVASSLAEGWTGACAWSEAAAAFARAYGRLVLDGLATPPDDALAVAAAIDRLAAGDRAGLAPVGVGQFRAALRAELQATPQGRRPPQAAPVELLTLADAAAAAADRLVLLGMAAEDLAGASLAPVGLSEAALNRLADAGRSPDGPEVVLSESLRRAALALGGAREVSATYTARGRLGPRPVWQLLADAPEQAPPRLPLDAAQAVRQAVAGRRLDAFALAELAAGTDQAARAARGRLADLDGGATPYDGVVRGLAEPDDGTVWSVSALEEYGRCPYRYFLHHVLGLGEGADDDPLADADLAADRFGQAAHFALERLRRAARAEGREPLSSADLEWAARVLEQGLAEAFAPLGHLPLAGVSRQVLLSELRHLVARQVRAGDGVTVESEWRFGLAGAAPFVLDLPDGRRVALHGRVDRVWRDLAGVLRVDDYKTGAHLPEAEVAPDALQLAVYMRAAAAFFHADPERVTGRYASVTLRGGYRERVLAGTHLVAQSQRLRATVAAILDRIGAGYFPPRPQGGRHCRSCPYVDVCPGDVVDRAERKDLDRPVPVAPEEPA